MKNQNIKVAVIGRPNVGKSTLFNRLIKERRSIVGDVAGITRDRLYADIEWSGKNITLIDTGGLIQDVKDADEIIKQVKNQVYVAVDEADFILFLVDGISGITSQDEKIAAYLRKIKSKKKIFLTVNKIDTEKQLHLIHEFYALGFGEPYPVSAIAGSSGLADLLDKIALAGRDVINHVSMNGNNAINIAVVGKPNVGKSSILNCLAGEERSIVTDIPGTTRDSINTKIKVDDCVYNLIDTAGLRRKSKVSTEIERYSTLRAISSIEKSDVVCLVVDASLDISDQDQKIAALIKRREKPSIIIVSKWDLAKSNDTNTETSYEEYVKSRLHFINYSRFLFTSAIQNKGFKKIWETIQEVYKNSQSRVSTGKLNKLLERVMLNTAPPSKKGKQLRIYYVTQANINPPEIVFFVNDSELVNKQYQSFLEKEIRKQFDFTGTPIKLVFRNKHKN